MSALGQKQTCAAQKVMSALPPPFAPYFSDFNLVTLFAGHISIGMAIRRLTRKGADMCDDVNYLNSTKALWLEQKNPIWLWLAIKTSIQNRHPLPHWVLEYLEKIADHFLSDDVHVGDFARRLPSILFFKAKRGPQHPLKVFKRMRKNEQFAMKFAKHILADKKPSLARKNAANECDEYWQNADDKVLQTALREHFKRKRLPASTLAWQRIVLQWLFDNPHSYERYPDLPPITNRLAELAAISRNSAVNH